MLKDRVIVTLASTGVFQSPKNMLAADVLDGALGGGVESTYVCAVALGHPDEYCVAAPATHAGTVL